MTEKQTKRQTKGHNTLTIKPITWSKDDMDFFNYENETNDFLMRELRFFNENDDKIWKVSKQHIINILRKRKLNNLKTI